MAHVTKESIFDELSKRPSRQHRYNEALDFFGKAPGLEFDHVIHGFKWATLQPDSLVVDVGGGYGAASLALAASFSHLRFVVQDQAGVVATAPAVPQALTGRLAYETHDFFADQPARVGRPPAVFFLRWILHDWSDQHAISILRALAVRLTPGARLLINEYVVPAPGTTSFFVDKMFRAFDMSMLEIHNGAERDLDAWTVLLKQADSRYSILNVSQPPGSRLSLIEVGWSA